MNIILKFCFTLLLLQSTYLFSAEHINYDLVIRNGTIYDGSGHSSFKGDLAIINDKIVAIGNITGKGKYEVEAKGLAVAPGFINMLSWANVSLLIDGRSLGNIAQGVTLEVMGEGWSMGPLNKRVKDDLLDQYREFNLKFSWQTLSEYLHYLEQQGVSTNVASFVGATTLRIHQIGFEDRPATTEELATMKSLLAKEMAEGALGLGSSLIYAPSFYAPTEELIELAKVVSQYDGMYISHMRSEGNNILSAVDELIRIAKEASVSAEIYHLKMAGAKNWDKYQAVINKVNSARKSGLEITADMYLYTAGASALDASMPPWVQEGGQDAWTTRLKDPAIRAKVIEEMNSDTDLWENLFFASGADGIMLLGFKSEHLRQYIGKTLTEVAKMRGTSAAEAAIDLVIEDNYRIDVAYFLMTEENVRKQIALPWISFSSDSSSMAPEGVFLQSNPHPRAYGNFARLLGKYVREEKIISLAEAIRKLTSQPADNLKIKNRGRLKVGHYADIVIFDAETIIDHATFKNPHQLSTGVRDVFVNGQQVYKNGQHTGVKSGRFIKGPGYKKVFK